MRPQTTHRIPLQTPKKNAVRLVLCRTLAVLARFLPARYPRLDLESMPEHLQRDLGFLDGRDPRYEAAERR
ncbi:hypothetical protein C8J36_101309 [Rhizobium sp. PP-F2F-G48]|uniref:hypothetical protein n=1 Tax=Rhizobium sp. PP-F2F-G48 TaxID=2135651 RepID=UPI001048D387|nr:hypothetical protein [Rhizobium sp. PP-F2F-G48]TCM58408.1 hypothetical protein C8J36_101309 [Rhizobium sp. PP-F2F-G48]